MTVREKQSKTKQCPKCNEIKPTKEFKRRLSIAQSRAVLHNPNITTNYMADSKLCKDCQPKRKPPRLLNAKEIKTRMTNGDIRSVIGELKLKQLREALPKIRSKNMKEEWQKRKAQPYKQLKRHLQDQINRFGNRHYASTHLQDATRLQNSWNFQEAKRIMKDLLEQAEGGAKIPLDIQIASLIRNKPQGESQ